MASETIKDILQKQSQDINILFDDYKIEIQKHFKDLNEQIKSLKQSLFEKDDIIKKLNEELKDNDFNKQNYQNFSLVSNLSKQIREKELELKACNSQLRVAKKEIETLKDKIEVISEKDDIESYIKEQSELVLTQKEIDHDLHIILKIKEEEEAKKKIEEEEAKKKIKEEEEAKKKIEEYTKKNIEESEEEEESEISYVRKKIKGTYYFVSDENPPQIYQYLENNEIGSLVGKMNDKKAEFF
jgi:hypothetical protein